MSPINSKDPITTEWPPAGWLLKEEAARRLDLSEVRVANLAKEQPDKLHSKKQRNPLTKQDNTLIHAGDVEAILYQRSHPEEFIGSIEKRENPEKSGSSHAEVVADMMIQRWLQPPAPTVPAPRPWLTLDEAAEYSGLTKRWLLEQANLWAEEGEKGLGCNRTTAIAIRDMGKGSPGGRWRFLRTDLDHG